MTYLDDRPTNDNRISRTPAPAKDSTAVNRLRGVLLANSVTSAAAGLVAAIGPRWVNDRILDSAGAIEWTRGVGVGLIGFAIAVAVVAVRVRGRTLRRAAVEVSVIDLAWVAATAVVIATVDLSGFGLAVAIVMGVGVLDFATLQLFFARRIVEQAVR